MGKRLTFRSALHLNNTAIFGHHHVHVGLRGGVFDVLQIADGFAIYDTDGDRGHHPFHRIGFQLAGGDQLIQRIGQRHAGTGNGGGAGAAVGLQYIAVESNREFAQRFQVNRQRSARAIRR